MTLHVARESSRRKLSITPGILAYNGKGELLDSTEKLALSIFLMAMAKADRNLHYEEERALKEQIASAMGINLTELQDYLASSEALLREKHILRHAAWVIDDDFSSRQREAICQILDMVAVCNGRLTNAEKTLEHRLRKMLEVPEAEDGRPR